MTSFDHRSADFGASGFDGLPDWDETDGLKREPSTVLPGHKTYPGGGPYFATRSILLAVATLVASSLYMAGVFVAAIAWGNHVAAIGAVITAGLCYLSYMAQMWATDIAKPMVTVSVVAGVIAGLSLLVW
jgi:hypothetical protein